MTGYSKVNKNINDVFYTVEMKGVNHKYLNISFFLPYLFSSFEARSLPIVQSEIKRGSISIKIDIRGNFESSLVIPDLELAKSYFKAFKEIEREIGVELRLDLGQLLEIKDIFKMSLDIQTEDKIWEGFQTVLTEAIENYNKSREAEGEKLRVYLEDQMVSLDEIMKKMNTYESQNREKYKEMILQSLKDNFSEIQMDPQRIEQEVIMTIQRRRNIEGIRSHVQGSRVDEIKSGCRKRT